MRLNENGYGGGDGEGGYDVCCGGGYGDGFGDIRGFGPKGGGWEMGPGFGRGLEPPIGFPPPESSEVSHGD